MTIQNYLALSGLQETWITPDTLYGDVLWVKSPLNFSCLGECYTTVLL